jgi:hypothetical protein
MEYSWCIRTNIDNEYINVQTDADPDSFQLRASILQLNLAFQAEQIKQGLRPTAPSNIYMYISRSFRSLYLDHVNSIC